MTRASPSDADLLGLLDMNGRGLGYTAISQRIGWTRSAVAGALKRLRDADADAEHGHARPGEPDSRDGEMGPDWLKAGLQAQEAAV